MPGHHVYNRCCSISVFRSKPEVHAGAVIETCASPGSGWRIPHSRRQTNLRDWTLWKIRIPPCSADIWTAF